MQQFRGLLIFFFFNSLFKIVAVGSLKQNDLIIAVGDQLEFLKNGNTYETLTLHSYNASMLSALAYDATTGRLFFSDVRNLHGHIFSVNLTDESRRSVQHIVEKNGNENVESLTYDPVDKMLLWTDGLNKSIRRVHIDDDRVITATEEKAAADGVEIVHFLEYDAKPRGLVSDPCNRMLYWTNIHDSRPTIERSFLNGSHREIVVETDLLLPNSLGLDVLEQRLYWAESLTDGYFHIERSFVNGTGRQEIYRGIGQFVVSLAVGDDFVYWSDYSHKKLWFLRKDGSSKRPLSLGTFRNPAMSVMIVAGRQPLNCCHLSSSETCHHQPSNELVIKSQPGGVNEEWTSSDFNGIDVCTGFCYHNGECVVLLNCELQCRCPVGFGGDRCELPDEQQPIAWSYNQQEVKEMMDGEMIETIAKTCVPVTCFFFLIAIVAIVKLRLLSAFKFQRGSNKDEKTQNLDNCYKMCEIKQSMSQHQSNMDAQDNSWKQSGDCATLIENEF